MNTSQNRFSYAGVSETHETRTYEIFWGGDRSHIQILRLPAQVDGALRDVNNENATILRPGMMMAKRTADGKFVFYNPAGADGSEVFLGVLEYELVMVDPLTGTSEGKFTELVVTAPVYAETILIAGEPLVGHASEAAARAALAPRFILDDLLDG